MKLLPFVLLVACGDDGGVRPLPDAPPGQITITARQGTAPIAGATVYVQSPSSVLLATVVTDASGTATADGVVAGSSVTLVPDEGTRLTVLDVQPNDEVAFARRAIGGTLVSVQVRPSTQATLYRYVVQTTCGGAQLVGMTSGSFYVRDCETADVVVDVQNTSYDSLEFAYASDQSVSDALDLSALVYTQTTAQPFDLANVPDSWNDLHLYRSLWTAKGPVYECDGFGSVLRCPTVPGASIVDRVTAYDDTVWHESYFPATSAAPSIDFAGLPIETVPEKPTIDLATSSVRWIGGAGANIAQVTLTEAKGSWTVYGAAPSDGEFRLPRLPDGLVSFSADVEVQLMLVDVVGGYPTMRQRVFATDPPSWVTVTGDRVITAAYVGGF